MTQKLILTIYTVEELWLRTQPIVNDVRHWSKNAVQKIAICSHLSLLYCLFSCVFLIANFLYYSQSKAVSCIYASTRTCKYRYIDYMHSIFPCMSIFHFHNGLMFIISRVFFLCTNWNSPVLFHCSIKQKLLLNIESFFLSGRVQCVLNMDRRAVLPHLGSADLCFLPTLVVRVCMFSSNV